VFHYICTVIVLFLIISMLWPDPRKKQAAADRKHKELVATISKMERQIATLVPGPPPPPNYTRAYRERVIALGRQRDIENGVKRHPLLDAPYVSVAIRPASMIRATVPALTQESPGSGTAPWPVNYEDNDPPAIEALLHADTVSWGSAGVPEKSPCRYLSSNPGAVLALMINQSVPSVGTRCT
jgi:hypothetical protein